MYHNMEQVPSRTMALRTEGRGSGVRGWGVHYKPASGCTECEVHERSPSWHCLQVPRKRPPWPSSRTPSSELAWVLGLKAEAEVVPGTRGVVETTNGK